MESRLPLSMLTSSGELHFPLFSVLFAAVIHASYATGASGAGLHHLLLPEPLAPQEHHRPPPHRRLTAATPPQ
jgi:hypothetical protein